MSLSHTYSLSYTYSLSSDFGGNINIQQFQNEILNDSSISDTLIGIERNDDDIIVTFKSLISYSEKKELDQLVTNHIPNPLIFDILNFITITASDSPYNLLLNSLYCDTSSDDIIIKLPKAIRNQGFRFAIKKINANNNVVINCNSGDTIDGHKSLSLIQNHDYIVAIADNHEWILITGNNDISMDVSNLASVTNNTGDIIVDDGETQCVLEVGDNDMSIIADSSHDIGITWGYVDHNNLLNKGTNTHTQIDAHIGATVAHGLNGVIVGTSDTQTLTNKIIDCDSNTVSNIDNNNIKTDAGIDISKISNGIVTETEFQYLNGVTSDIQTQFDNITSADGSVNTHSDITISSPTSGQILKYNGSIWQNASDITSSIGGTPLAMVMVRGNSGEQTVSTSFVDVLFPNTDIETDASIIEHDSDNNQRINIKEDGYYQISYHFTHDSTNPWNQCISKIVKNGTTDIVGSTVENPGYSSGVYDILGTAHDTIIAWLTNGEYITLQVHVVHTTPTRYDPIMHIIKLDGIIGPQGPQGADGNIVWQGTWDSGTIYNINDVISHNGSSYVCIIEHSNQVPPNATYWDIMSSKGNTGKTGIQGPQGESGLIDWQGAWTTQNYTKGQSVSHNGSTYICILDTVSNEDPSNNTYWDLIASKGDKGSSGSGTTIIIQDNGSSIPNTPHSELNFIKMQITDTGSGQVNIEKYISHCDIYYKPLKETTVPIASGWIDVPMNIERAITAEFSHITNAPEVTINQTDIYMIMARCSTYYTGSTRTGCQFRLVRSSSKTGVYSQIEGSIGYLYNRGYSGTGYSTSNVALIMTLESGDKIKMQCDVLSGTNVKLATEACSILIKSI